ncbi:DUF4388 domain-containing protein [Desulfobulbus oligotrophicus]|jgi:hypothetical protein|uniref:DUF4388 domain-containing protein n=1 Tax=Desulfobulbus oligotrophicus TaxID=1909699 RepID=A0A7T6AQG0_9BACT|nr:DUF4388 domain-containing protein [Desulfobulbus oligotrophicus]MDY0389699.1 DUF4388 domain-containing protein [Desulfobulbus oligotrophicus]QQG65527.1 DUF4388 domain-containing protein [Desulfobulbus oligotrophicus]
MKTFNTAFEITHVQNCPLYMQDDCFVLTDKAVELPLGRASCLILVRELTGVLFTLIPDADQCFAKHHRTIFTCGGCTGLIKFRLTEKPVIRNNNKDVPAFSENPQSVISGRIEAIHPAELLQVFHMHQKTGRLVLEFANGSARVTFREGGLLAARFEDFDNQEAIYAMLAEKKGTFHFIPGLPDALMQTREIGDFMMILMEGLRRLDEEA